MMAEHDGCKQDLTRETATLNPSPLNQMNTLTFESSLLTTSLSSDPNAQRAARALIQDFGLDKMTVSSNNNATTHSDGDKISSMDSDANSRSGASPVMPELSLVATSSTVEDSANGIVKSGRDPPASSCLSSPPSSASFSIPSFTFDSPYLQSYLDREMQNLHTLAEALRDISARAQTFGKCGALMAEATRRLSRACKFDDVSEHSIQSNCPSNQEGYAGTIPSEDPVPLSAEENDDECFQTRREQKQQQEMIRKEVKKRRDSLGTEMASALSVLGEILDEVASAQLSMCQSVEAALSQSLEVFANVELNEATRLRNEAEILSEMAEGSFEKYMHGKHSERANLLGVADGTGIGSGTGGTGGIISVMDPLDQQNLAASWNKLSDHVGSQLKNWTSRSVSSFGESSNINNTSNNTKNNGVKELVSSTEEGPQPKAHAMSKFGLRGRVVVGGGVGASIMYKNDEKDPVLATVEAAANLRYSLEQIRLAQANAELRRFHLLRRLDSIKSRRNFELGESALASLNGIRTYFHHCSDLIENIVPTLSLLQDNQAHSRGMHETQQAPWDRKLKSLSDAISTVEASTVSAGTFAETFSLEHAEDLDENILTSQPLSLDEIETSVKFWDLPRQLSIGSLYQRKPTPGIIMEGWLYKKNSNRLSLNTWSKRWFLLDKNGVYYLNVGSLSEGKSGGKNNAEQQITEFMDRVKICDILLCTVREINSKAKGNLNLRWCFEIISPNSKSYILQACGPRDYDMWVRGIRSCIEQQLVNGQIPPDDALLKNNKIPRKFGRVNAPSSKGRTSAELDFSSHENENKDESDGSRRSSQTSGGPALLTYELNHPLSSSNIRSPLVPKILQACPICADCGNADPDWACVNLGVVVCIECSGVHRSLGVHVSKVRSLRLDKMTENEYKLLLELGNEKVNKIWEAGLHHQKGWTKPSGGASRKTKEEWIKSKYLWKGFLEYLSEDGSNQEEREAKFNHDLFEAARRCDLMGISEALAKGGSVDWKNEEEGGKTALHICVVGKPSNDQDIASWKGLECAEFLIQNGSKLNAEDFDHHKALDCAVVGNARREMIEYLEARGP